MDNVDRFLQSSPMASQVKVDTEVVLHRTAMSTEDLERLQSAGSIGPTDARQRICELVVGGQVLASGKIVKKGGSFYFKVLETANSTEEEISK